MGLARPMIVIVDDDPAVRASLAFSLKAEGFSVQSYADGAELLTSVRPNEIRCYIIDYKLPDMNGLDLLVELRRHDIAAPTILITTNPTAAVRARAAAVGTVLIEKPLLGDALFQEIRAALGT
jgi:two-component system response regulator FixJ